MTHMLNSVSVDAHDIDDPIVGREDQPDTMDMKTIGRRARTLRLEKNWTQKELARRANVTPNTIRGFERGTLQTRWPKIHDIAQALGTTFEQLQGEAVKPSDPLLADLTREDLLVARTYHHSTTDVRQRVLALLQHGQTDADKTADASAMDELLSRLDPRRRELIERMITTLLDSEIARPATTTSKQAPSKTRRAKKA